MRILPALLVVLFVVGCGPSAQTRGYRVAVENRAAEPVTLWLTKTGGPYQDAWASPEDIRTMNQVPDRTAAIILPPDSAAEIPSTPGLFEGKFNPGVQAVLRVYVGELDISGMLATSRGTSLREDVQLAPGANRVVIVRTSPLEVERESVGE